MNEAIMNFCATHTLLVPSILIVLAVFDLIFRGFALWHSARKSQKIWFIFLLVVNSVGILPIVYLLLNQKKKD